MTDHTLYPVLDLLGGRLMRALRDVGAGPALVDDDPVVIALRWREQGAQWLHLVDLDGAREGAPRQLEIIHTIIQAARLPAQVAGGLRDTASVEAALEAGAERVVLSAATPDDQALVAECVARWGERIAVALEARDGRVTVAGWLPSDAATALDVARAMGYLGVETLLFTSATTGGASDPLPGALRRALPDMRLIAGGAVTTHDDLRRLLALGMDGVLLGRALYEGLFTLEEALAVARENAASMPTTGFAALASAESMGKLEMLDITPPVDGEEALEAAETQEITAIAESSASDQPVQAAEAPRSDDTTPDTGDDSAQAR